MAFGDLKTEAGLQALNSHLEDKSYIEGYLPSQADTTVFDSMNGSPCESLAHALRWYNHIASYGSERTSFPSVEGKADPVTNGVSKDDDEDDDVDLFGSSSEEEEDDEEAAKIKQERIDAYNAKKSKKAVVQAKSSILLDVKPWDDETDMLEVEKMVRTIVADGLLWGQAKLVPLAYGIKKLQIGCVVHDDKIGTDFLEEEITKFSDFVQSVDIAAFNKI